MACIAKRAVLNTLGFRGVHSHAMDDFIEFVRLRTASTASQSSCSCSKMAYTFAASGNGSIPAIPSRKLAIIKEYACTYANGIAYPKSDVDVRGFLPACSLPASRP